ncbi:hypothetical protein KKB44_03820 [Candidatus Micrarchaeota archaeon]|nr:hypothetical protein [Candidatus Micrarchaeota archaeon]
MAREHSDQPAKVIPFSRARKPATGRALKNISTEGLMAEILTLRSPNGKNMGRDRLVEKKFPRKLNADECAALLSGIAPITPEISQLLQIPKTLYMLGNEPSFSSQQDRGINEIVKSLLYGSPMPVVLPDYGIYISSRGSNVFCTLVDKKRKIIVHATINSMYAKQGSWKSFQQTIQRALDTAKSYETKKEPFNFVLTNEGITSTL